MHLTPSAQLVINSADRQQFIKKSTIVNTVPPTTIITPVGVSQPINNFSIASIGQNIVQGAIDRIQVAEVNFPYDIPTIVTGVNDRFTVIGTFAGPPPVVFTLTAVVPQGFYTGDELVNAINAAVIAGNSSSPSPFLATELPTFVYDSINNLFSITRDPTATLDIGFTEPGQAVLEYTNRPQFYPRSLLYTIGFLPTSPNSRVESSQSGLLIDANPGGPVPAETPATLLYTQFIDICSRALCGQVYVPDGSTSYNPFRKDLLCRLYIADESSNPIVLVPDANGDLQVGQPGSRPFTIHRQFRNAKMIPNLNVNSINDVDISLFDDRGQLLLSQIVNGEPVLENTNMRNFQLTLNVFETAKDVAK